MSQGAALEEDLHGEATRKAPPDTYHSSEAVESVVDPSWFYVDDEGVEQGPFSSAQLYGWLRRGLLKQDRRARREGGDMTALTREV